MTFRRRPVVFVAGVAVFVFALAYLVYGGIQQGATYWVTVGELRGRTGAAAQARVRLGGTVVPGSIAWDPSHQHLRFSVTDGTDAIPVHYSGVIPDIFSAGRQVVVEGALLSDGSFTATTLLAKCPTKYSPADPQSQR
ncbi:MAG TPA: cytochrome c maturation protein CcmE [bacterium]|nr:cytochrome c maturation protein CcmE [bacterium]